MISSIITLIIAFLCLIALMIIHEFGHFIIAKKFGVRVDEFGIGYPPRIFGKKFGETIYSVNWIPLGAFVKIYGEEGGVDDYRSFIGLKIWKRVLIVIGGVAAFWIASIILFSVVFALGAEIPVGDQQAQGVSQAVIKVISVEPGSPADQAGIKKGDSILEIRQNKIDKISEFQKITSESRGETVNITLNRNNKNFEVSLVPRQDPKPGQGAVGVGIERMATLIEKTPWYRAPLQGAIYTWQTTANGVAGLYGVFKNMFLGKGMPQGAEFAGPLGITVFLAQAVDYGPGFFLYFIGVISVFVAIFNLFPIPALDGGKLVFLAIEKIMKKPVPQNVEQNITIIFFILLISLSLFITIRFDVPRFLNFFNYAK